MSEKKENEKKENIEEVVLLYVDDFRVLSEHPNDDPKPHLKPGRIYRAFYDKEFNTYRTVFEDNEPAVNGMKGLVFVHLSSEEFAEEMPEMFQQFFKPRYKYAFTKINSENILTIDIDTEDFEKLALWKDNGHIDLDPYRLENMAKGAIQNPPAIPEEGYGENYTDYEDIDFSQWALGCEGVDEAFKSLTNLHDIDHDMCHALANIISYINGTYGDKYEAAGIASIGHTYTQSKAHGRSFNIVNAIKYLQRYLTDGFKKSNNPNDLLKAVHFIAFEIQRRQNDQN
jgi:hypothetical protein